MAKTEVNVAVVGTGAVGQEILRVLDERRFPLGELRLLATARSAGQRYVFGGREYEVGLAEAESFDGVDLCFFAASNDASRDLAPEAVARGATVIDKSSYFRLRPDVPLVVPEVNGEALREHRGIIASPNCSTIQLVMALKPIADAAGLRRVVVSTYQSVSGTGREAMEELRSQSLDVLSGAPPRVKVYTQPIAFNLLPQIDAFGADGYTGEERKLMDETRKILRRPDLAITATAVRVPVFIGHAEAVNLQTDRPMSPEEAREVMAAFPGVILWDDPQTGQWPTPLAVAGTDDVYVGRVRRDLSVENGLALFVVADNLRKGAATNAVQIAERLVAWEML